MEEEAVDIRERKNGPRQIQIYTLNMDRKCRPQSGPCGVYIVIGYLHDNDSVQWIHISHWVYVPVKIPSHTFTHTHKELLLIYRYWFGYLHLRIWQISISPTFLIIQFFSPNGIVYILWKVISISEYSDCKHSTAWKWQLRSFNTPLVSSHLLL